MDQQFEAVKVQQGALVPYFLMASYLYYIHDISPIPDHQFDLLCKRMLDEWKDIQHPHKCLIKKGDLAAGSGYAIPERKFPTITKSAAFQWARSIGALNAETQKDQE